MEQETSAATFELWACGPDAQEIGTDYPHSGDPRQQAAEFAREIIDQDPDGDWDWEGWTVFAVGEDGTVLAKETVAQLTGGNK